MSRESTNDQNQQDGPALTTSQHVLLQKQQEYAGLQALRESSADMVARVEKLGKMSSIMADGGEGEFVFSLVVALWPGVSGLSALALEVARDKGREGGYDILAREHGIDNSARTGSSELATHLLRPQSFR